MSINEQSFEVEIHLYGIDVLSIVVYLLHVLLHLLISYFVKSIYSFSSHYLTHFIFLISINSLYLQAFVHFLTTSVLSYYVSPSL